MKVGFSDVSHHCSRMIKPADEYAMASDCAWRIHYGTAGAFERRETIFEMLSELIPCFRAPRATALPSCTDCGGRDPGSEALAGILSANGHLSTGQTPLQAYRLAPSLRDPGPETTVSSWQ